MTVRIGKSYHAIRPKYKLSEDPHQNADMRVARRKREVATRYAGEWKWDGEFTRKEDALTLFDTMPDDIKAGYYVTEGMSVYF